MSQSDDGKRAGLTAYTTNQLQDEINARHRAGAIARFDKRRADSVAWLGVVDTLLQLAATGDVVEKLNEFKRDEYWDPDWQLVMSLFYDPVHHPDEKPRKTTGGL